MGNARASRAMVRPSSAAGCALAALLLLVLASGRAESETQGSVYRHVDERGVIHFSDVPIRARLIASRPPPPGMRDSFEWRTSRPPRYAGYDDLIADVSRRHRVQPALVKAVVAAESNFNPLAVSHKGAQGLMQLMPDTAEQLGVEDPLRAEENLSGGVRYLRAMLVRYGELDHALAAYNAGPRAVDRYQGIPPYPETKAYVRRVLNYYRGYHGDFRR